VDARGALPGECGQMNAIEEKAALDAWKGHNRRVIQQSARRLRHRKQRRNANAVTRRRLAELAVRGAA
jgi:hypothetical protein